MAGARGTDGDRPRQRRRRRSRRARPRAAAAAPGRRRDRPRARSARSPSIESIEQDYEGRVHLAVVIEDDPGMDLGLARQPGHRFFFSPDEVEPRRRLRTAHGQRSRARHGSSSPASATSSSATMRSASRWRAASARRCRPACRVVDFGIRGLDLVYALMDGFDLAILVDAVPRGGAPGTLYTIEPELPRRRGSAGGPGRRTAWIR